MLVYTIETGGIVHLEYGCSIQVNTDGIVLVSVQRIKPDQPLAIHQTLYT